MSFPFSTLDLLSKYIRHDVPIYCHDHPTQPDGMNACVKEIETRLKAFELPDTNSAAFEPVFVISGNPQPADLIGGKVLFCTTSPITLPVTLNDQTCLAFWVYARGLDVTIIPQSNEYFYMLGTEGNDGQGIQLAAGGSCLIYGWDGQWLVVSFTGSCILVS